MRNCDLVAWIGSENVMVYSRVVGGIPIITIIHHAEIRNTGDTVCKKHRKSIGRKTDSLRREGRKHLTNRIISSIGTSLQSAFCGTSSVYLKRFLSRFKQHSPESLWQKRRMWCEGFRSLRGFIFEVIEGEFYVRLKRVVVCEAYEREFTPVLVLQGTIGDKKCISILLALYKH